MKKVFIAMSLSAGAMFASAAMAAPHHYSNKHHDRYDRFESRIKPNRDWRSGQHLPTQFKAPRYIVDYRSYRHLSKPGRFERWYRVNGDYVLINERNNRIIRVIG